jgi:hypothetical protein
MVAFIAGEVPLDAAWLAQQTPSAVKGRLARSRFGY